MLWNLILGIMVVGYVSLGKSFAYLGIPSAHVFIGEIVLVALLLVRPRAIVDRWYAGLSSSCLTGTIAWSYFAFLCFGVLEVAHGIYQGFPPLAALESLVFQVYPLYLFAGMFVAGMSKDFIRKVVLWLAWWNCFYGLAYIFVLNRVSLMLPGTDVPLFWGTGGGSLVLIGILCFEQKLTRVFIPLMINLFIVLAMQVRAEWLGLILVLSCWAMLTRRVGRLAFGVGAVAVLLTVAYAVDFSIPSPAGRGGNISFQDIASRAVASVDAEKAREFSRSADQYAGTVTWRKTWWSAIWDSVHEDQTTALIGHGYGFPIGDLVSFLKNVEIRTPHNVFFYALAYGGWSGVCLFFIFQASLGYGLWRTFLLTGQPFGILLWLMSLTAAFFGSLFETPFGAIPTYILLGAALAPGIEQEPRLDEVSAQAELMSPGWRIAGQ